MFFTVKIVVIFSTVGLNDFFGTFVQMVNILSIFDLSKKLYVKYSHIFFIMFLPLGPIFLQGSGASEGANFKTVKKNSLEKELLRGVVFQWEQNVKNLRHFFFREENYSRGVVFQREQNVKNLRHFFFREENYSRGGSAPGGANVKIGRHLGSLIFGTHFFLGY